MIINAAIRVTEVLKSLLVEDSSEYALTFNMIISKLTSCQNNKSKGKEILPPQLPDPLLESDNLTFRANRKRALTSREVADKLVVDEARRHRKAKWISWQQEIAENTIDQDLQQRRQEQDENVTNYLAAQVAVPRPSKTSQVEISSSESSSESSSKSSSKSSSESDESSSLTNDDKPPSTSITWPTRARKPISKKASQIWRDIEKEAVKAVKLRRKLKTKKVSQLDT
jgi:hypothetical protein